jgi:outer membrane protein, heavy metal efflux system
MIRILNLFRTEPAIVRQRAQKLVPALVLGLCVGCAGNSQRGGPISMTPRAAEAEVTDFGHSVVERPATIENSEVLVRKVSHETESLLEGADDSLPLPAPAMDASSSEELNDLVSLAAQLNPKLRLLEQKTAAAWAKVRYVDKLPDPTIGTNVFAHPIETAAGSQRASLSVMQMIPWLARLDAQTQQAAYEAMALQQNYEAERLKVVAEVRVAWTRLYVLGKQLETLQSSRQLLETLVEVASAKIATGEASQGDVLRGTLELSRLKEQEVNLQRQVASTRAVLNSLLARDADHPLPIPAEIQVRLPGGDHQFLLEQARTKQPEIEAARLRTGASSWGIEVARLRQRPDFSLSANWFAIDDNRPASPIVDVGRDAWSVGMQMSIPLWHGKYKAMAEEATWNHFSTHAEVEETVLRYDALLQDLWARATAAHEVSNLYRETIIPQARQTLETDQRSFAENTVEFDRLIQDFRNLLVLELTYHQSRGELAIAVARIEQAVGGKPDLETVP